MAIPLRITMTESIDFEQLSIRLQRSALRATYLAMGERWRSKMLPRHFIRGAGTRYGYKPRSAKYDKRKRALAAREPGLVKEGGRVLLVFSGQLRDHLLNGGGTVVRSFPTRASITLTAPHGLPLRPRSANKPNIGQELTAVTPEEEQELADVAGKTLAKEIKAARVRKRTVTKG